MDGSGKISVFRIVPLLRIGCAKNESWKIFWTYFYFREGENNRVFEPIFIPIFYQWIVKNAFLPEVK